MSRVDLGDPDLYTAMIARLKVYRMVKDSADSTPRQIADASEQYDAAYKAWDATLATEVAK